MVILSVFKSFFTYVFSIAVHDYAFGVVKLHAL